MTHERTIRQRCRRIARLLRHGQSSPSENLIDVLADARHWCDHNAESFWQLDRQAHRHYLAELDASRKQCLSPTGRSPL